MPRHDTQKLLQYLNEAHATEVALIRVLQSQIAMTPRGSYRTGLESHLAETREHADRVQRRLKDLGQGRRPVTAAVGAVESVVGQALALAKTPLDLVRGDSGEEKVLKNAKDAAATEALEIATYTAIERLAKALGDDTTAKLAASIRADEERMAEAVSTTATGLLTLLGIEADPVQSREHILLSGILHEAWSAGRDLDLAALIQAIHQPAFTRVGVLDLEAFYPQKDRFALAMRLNGLLAAPGFALWLEGEPLDVASLLRTPGGKPRVAIV